MIRYRDPQFEFLGKFVARLDDLLNWVPSRLTAVMLVVAGGVSGGDWRAAWRVMVQQHGRTASPNAGWPMAAAAGALGVALAKAGRTGWRAALISPAGRPSAVPVDWWRGPERLVWLSVRE